MKTDLDANENLKKDFKERFNLRVQLIDARNKADVRNTFSETLHSYIGSHMKEVNLQRTLTKAVEEQQVKEEPKLLPKKDDGCQLI